MTPEEYREEVVKPNVQEMEQDYGSIRKALNALHSVDSFAAHIFVFESKIGKRPAKDDSSFREELARQSPDFRLLRDTAKAIKHVVIERGKPEVSTAEQVSAKSLGWGQARWGGCRWGSPVQVCVVTESGEHRVLESIIKSSLAILDDYLANLSAHQP